LTWNRCCDHEYGCQHAAALILATYIVGKGGGRGRERGREGERERGREGRKSSTIGKKEEDGKRAGERKREEEEGGHDPHIHDTHQ